MSAEQGDPLRAEIMRRQQRIKEEMAKRRVDVLVLTGQASFEYFTGYRSEFWASTTRPFYAVIVPDRHPCTIIVHQSEQRSTEFDIAQFEFILYRLFLEDALEPFETLSQSWHPRRSGSFSIMGRSLRARVTDPGKLLRNLSSRPEVIEGDELIWSVRAIKSEYEIEMKRRACHIAPQSFFAALKDLKLGQTEREFGRGVTINMFQRGAD